jgi:hypothetical protein
MNTLFLTTASVKSMKDVGLMIDSLRTFGGELAEAPFWVFVTDTESVHSLEDERTRLLPLAVPDLVSAYPFGIKVAACARAEELAPAGTRSLVWVDAACLICQPPTLFTLGTDCEAAFRPVHIRNVGLPPSEPLDAFWSGIYAALGVDDIRTNVTSFVDGQLLRTYFNSHAFAINPTLGLMRRWYELFRKLVNDTSFQSAACADERHQIFLFQALLSALVASSVEPGRVCILPPAYNYPYNLQERIPAERTLAVLNEAVCFTYEERDIRPNAVTGIEVREPLRSWLDSHLPKKE